MKNRLMFVCFVVASVVLPIASYAQTPGLKQPPSKTTLMSGGAIVVNGKVLEKVVLTANSTGPIDWDYDEEAFPDTRAEVCLSEKKLILFPIAKGSYKLRLLMWDEKKFQKINLVITDGPIPPPVTPPIVDPVKPPAPKADLLTLATIWESADSTPEIARVMKDLDFWQGLQKMGHKFAQIDKDQKELGPDGKETGRLLIDARGYRPYIDKLGLPTLLVFSQQGALLASMRLPDSTDKIRAIVKDITGK